jgi:hypothetical protein
LGENSLEQAAGSAATIKVFGTASKHPKGSGRPSAIKQSDEPFAGVQSFEIIAFAGAFKENAGGCSLLYCHVGRRERTAPTALIVESRNSSKELPLLPRRPLALLSACSVLFAHTVCLCCSFILFCDDNKASFKRSLEKLSERRAHKLLQMCNLFISLCTRALFCFLICAALTTAFAAGLELFLRMCVEELPARDFHLR